MDFESKDIGTFKRAYVKINCTELCTYQLNTSNKTYYMQTDFAC
jgi:hypothetical protein